MKRKNRKNKKNLHMLKDAKTHHTRGGEVTFGRVSLMEVIENVRITPCPEQPWDRDETYRRWEHSNTDGPRQLAFKCQNCSLEFVVHSLRSEVEFLEQFRPSHGEHGGLCAGTHCPECGQARCYLLVGEIMMGRSTGLSARSRWIS